MAEKITITRAPRGAARQEVELDRVHVPDLWHIGQWLEEHKPNIGHHHLGEGMTQGEAVLYCWHLCHDLIENIRDPSLVKRS